MEHSANLKEVKWNDKINIRVPAWALYALPFIALVNNGADIAVGVLFMYLVSSGQLGSQTKWGEAQWRKFWIVTLSVLAIAVIALAAVFLQNKVLMKEIWQMLQR